MVRIDFLKNHPQHVETVARWIFEAWGDGTPEGSARAVARVRDRLNDDGVPLTLVALDGGEPVGTVSLFEQDLEGWNDLSPWLAALYVVEGRRSEGIGTMLADRVVAVAFEIGRTRIYLQAQDAAGFYSDQGWLRVGSAHTERGETTVFTRHTSTSPRILYRADGGLQLGFGHVMHAVRLEALLRAQGVAEVVVVGAGDDSVDGLLRQHGMPARFDVTELGEGDTTLALARDLGAAAVAVNLPKDSLERATGLFEALKGAGIPQIHFDDPMQTVRFADLAINALPHPDWGLDLAGLASVYEGLEYLLVDDDFVRAVAAKRQRSAPPTRVLVSMGGTDPQNLSTLVLQGLEFAGFTGLAHVVLGAGNPHSIAVHEAARAVGFDVDIHDHLPSLAPLVGEVDLAFSALGLTTYEFALAGLPVVLIAGSEFNASVANLHADRGSALSLGYYRDWTAESLGEELRGILEDSELLGDLASAGPQLVDGKGAERVGRLVVELLSKESRA